MEQQERHLQVTRDKAGKISTYENHEKNDFITEDEIIGFDANVFVDLVLLLVKQEMYLSRKKDIQKKKQQKS